MIIQKAAVFGAGTMGSGIAYILAKAGIEVILMDVSAEIAINAKSFIETKLLKKDIEKNKIKKHQEEEIKNKVVVSSNINDAQKVDIVIEAIFEDFKKKKELFLQLNKICPSSTIFASNTSTISITKLAEASLRPENFIGLHFFNPVHTMKLVEIIPGLKTKEETIEKSLELTNKIGKFPIKVKNCPGFLVNRILLSYIGESYIALEEGISPMEIDQSIKQIGFPMGPIELTDMVGHDISVHTFPILNDAYGERFPIPLIPKKLVERGRLGLKTNKGIYINGNIDNEFFEIIKNLKTNQINNIIPFSAERLILRQINEAIYCLAEGIATAEEIDKAMVLGTGFPLGGPLHLADLWGLDKVISLLESYRETAPSRFWPHYLLKEYVNAGYLGKKVGKGFFDYFNKEREVE